MVAALAAEEDESQTALALEGAISSAMATRLATSFRIETGGAVPPLAPRREPVPDSSFNIADLMGAVPRIDRMDPHREFKSIYLPAVHGVSGRATENVLPILAGTGGPRRTENHLGLPETENWDPYRLIRRHAPGMRRTEAEFTRYSDAEDPRHRTNEDREERRWRYRNNCEARHGRYRNGRGGRYPYDDDQSSSEDSRRQGHQARRDRSRDRHWHDPSDSEDYYTESDEGRRRSSRLRRATPIGDERRPMVIRPLNDLFNKAVNYKTYLLERRGGRYDSKVARNINRYPNKLDVQMKYQTFSSQDPIALLGFLARLRIACDHNGITDGVAVWCFQLYLTGQAHALIQSRLIGNTMADDVERRELLRTYQQVVNVLLRTYATEEVISEATGGLNSFRQSSNMTEEVYSNHLWDKALCCSTVFSDWRSKSLFVEGLLSATCTQVRNYLATHPDVDCQSIARYAQEMGGNQSGFPSTGYVSHGMSAMAPRESSGAARRFDRPARTRPVLSVESASDIPTPGAFAEEAILAVTNRTPTRTSMSSPPTSHYPSPAASVAGAPSFPTNPGDVRTGPCGRQGQNPRVRFPSRGLPGLPPCRLILDTTHRQEECPVVADAV